MSDTTVAVFLARSIAVILVIAVNLGILAASVWVVVKVLQLCGVL